jgi:undecaprenyl-diphosphatase
MTEIINAIVLGVVQGLTEFLPVSSSGHIEIAKALLPGTKIAGNQTVLMTVVLHFATAISTIVVFRKEVGEILQGLIQFKYNEHAEFTLKIILSMIPAAFVGVVFDKQIDQLFSSNMLLVGCMLLVTGLLLLLADRAKETDKKVSFLNALIVGISQAVAILPGISRSGATISTCVLLGIDRAKAARFSFLMVVPLIFGKMAKDMLSGEIWEAGEGQAIPLIVGFIAAFFTGLLACTWMISLVKAANLKWFSWYCFAVGAIAITAGCYTLLG